jgi:hypothetical protein
LRSKVFSCLALLVFSANFNLFAQQVSSDPSPAESSLERIPLLFEPNRGQAENSAQFVSRGNGYTVFLATDKTELVLPPTRDVKGQGMKSELSVITLEFLRANKRVRLEAADLLPGKSNYFIGNGSSNWIAGVPQYARINLKSIYPGIDLVYYGNNGLLEYDFVLSPGADPGVLGLRVSGADKISADVSGNLLLQARNGTVQLQKPTIYQETSGVRHIIEGKFILRADNEVGFIVYDYDRTKPLVVDPVLSYSTLIGANNSTQVQGVAVDPSGNVIIAGTTYATNYPTVAAFQPTNHGTSNVFITKLNPAGNVILYSTYLGGSGFDTGRAIAVDSAGNAYVTGSANSADFPTTPGAFNTTCPGFCNTSFVTKVLADGALGYSTFMGGVTGAWAIAVDSAGAAYITGTAGSGLPLVNAFQSAPAGGFAQKLKPDGTALDYSTYLGGGGDWGRGIAVDTSGSAYVVGSTSATNFPLKNALQSSLLYPLSNAFITKFSPDGASLAFSTYLGGTSPFNSSGDVATGVAIDPLGNIHITGTSSSCEFPLSLNAFNTDCGRISTDPEVFVVTLNSAGSQIVSSTFLQSGQGGSSPEIAVDKSGNSYIAGSTNSSNYPVLNPVETLQQALSNGFVTELDPSGKLLFSTYLGENSPGAPGYGAQIAGVTVDGKGGIYVAGAGQADFPLLHPIPNQVIQLQLFVAKISPGKSPQFSLSPRVSPMLALRNVSSVPLTISSIVPSSNFTMGGNCGTSLAPGGGCNLILIGADDKKTSGTVTITSNAYTTPQKFTISKSPSGDSLGSLVSIFPTFVQFPSQFFGTTSAAQRIVVKNWGLPAAINSISIIQPAAFTETNNCPALLNTAASCTISVTYSAATGQDRAQLVIVHDPNQARDTVYLSGPGSPSAIAASTSAVEFGSQQVGVPALARIVNLANTTPYPAVITGLSASAAYAQSNTCASALSPHKECRVSVTFAPTGNQDATGTLTVSNYGPGGPETIQLHATGIQPGDLVLSPVSLSFSGYVGFKTGPDTVTVTNNTQSAVTINVNNIKASAPFSQTHTCSSSLAPASSCQISVFFKATQPGAASGTLQVPFVGAGSPQTIALTGTAQAAQTTVQFYPLSVQFGEQRVKTSSSQTTVGVENNGTTTVTLGSVSIQGSEFSIAQNNCGTTLARNTGCGLEVVFTPSAIGGRKGTMSVTASDSSSPHTATLQGTGISNGIGTPSSSTLSFGTQKVGTQSKPLQVTFTNTGTGTLTLKGIAISPQLFTQSNTCASSLAAGAHCTVSVQFAPTLKGLLAGSLSIQDDGSVGQHSVALSGIGQ